MKKITTGAAIFAAVTFLGTATAIAQNEVGTGPTTVAVDDDRPNYTPLLGLLGLLGLMGLKRKRDTRDYDDNNRR